MPAEHNNSTSEFKANTESTLVQNVDFSLTFPPLTTSPEDGARRVPLLSEGETHSSREGCSQAHREQVGRPPPRSAFLNAPATPKVPPSAGLTGTDQGGGGMGGRCSPLSQMQT